MKNKKRLFSLVTFLVVLFMGLVSGAAVFASSEDETNLQTEGLLISVAVDKDWIGPEGDSVTVQLRADGINVGEPVTITASEGWTHTWYPLLQGYLAGTFPNMYWHTIDYTIEEIEVLGNDPYEIVISEPVVDNDDNISYTITNINQALMDIDATKYWIGPAAETANVSLYMGEMLINTVDLVAEGGSHTFTGLFKYDQCTGDTITYTLVEEALANHSTVITGDQDCGFVVTNTNITKIDIPVKVNMLCPNAESLGVNLLVNGSVVDTLVLDPGNSWMGAFTGLFKYDQTTGEEIPYTLGIGELKGDCNVDITVTGSLLEGFTVTATPVTTATVEATLPQTGDVSIIAGLLTVMTGAGVVTLTRKRK